MTNSINLTAGTGINISVFASLIADEIAITLCNRKCESAKKNNRCKLKCIGYFFYKKKGRFYNLDFLYSLGVIPVYKQCVSRTA